MKKNWMKIAGLACGIGIFSAPSWAEDNASLKQLKELGARETARAVVVDVLPRTSEGRVAVSRDLPYTGDFGYQELWTRKEFIDINGVKFEDVTPEGSGDGRNCVKLTLTGMSACSRQLLEFWDRSQDKPSVGFYGIGRGHGGFAQGACETKIEFFWEPLDFKLNVGQSSTAAMRIPLSDPSRGVPEAYFEVSSKITARSGPFPGGNGVGLYFDVSDVQVRKVQK